MTDDTQAPAGRETDAAVARAMGYEVSGHYVIVGFTPRDIPTYSADTDGGYAAMREVLAWIESRKWFPVLDRVVLNGLWQAEAHCTRMETPDIQCSAPSLPLAVCRLVLAVANAEREAKP